MKKKKLKNLEGIPLSELFDYKPSIINFFMLKMRWMMFISDIKYHLKKFFYCNRGWHKVGGGRITTTNHKGQKIVTNFVRCTNCEYYFFPTKKDKDNFNRIKDQEKAFFKKVFDSMLKKHKTDKKRLKI